MTIDAEAMAELEALSQKPGKTGKAKALEGEVIPPPKAVVKNTVRIVVEDSDDIPPSGLFVALNGRAYLIKTGVEVDIPLGLKEILDHAVISTPVLDPQTKKQVAWRSRPKYNYRMVQNT